MFYLKIQSFKLFYSKILANGVPAAAVIRLIIKILFKIDYYLNFNFILR